MKNIAFNVEGYIKVPDNATKEEIEETLCFYFEISDTMLADNPIDVDLAYANNDLRYNSVTVND